MSKIPNTGFLVTWLKYDSHKTNDKSGKLPNHIQRSIYNIERMNRQAGIQNIATQINEKKLDSFPKAEIVMVI